MSDLKQTTLTRKGLTVAHDGTHYGTMHAGQFSKWAGLSNLAHTYGLDDDEIAQCVALAATVEGR